ncbi:MAG TPA: hypothetical protein IAC85_01710 [Candidatus Faecenecus gallistercoris]|jgi:hypothetical protein|uniref:Uncharacterized protein n=1 Tax=Candidatus Faecenecus gallistercoris TaxID=2840793 RepID=A0A9D1CK53_9FIRM|nr:MAG: hypothetical protein DBY23_06760 [Bacillota bacterium]HIQ64432.1 hypothetical protein [Candidatus Faecenecus gallistercoris]
MEIIIIGGILLFVLLYNQTIDGQKFIRDNEKYFQMLKEDDYEFLVYAKYGESVDVNTLFNKRITYGFVTIVIFLFIFLTDLNLINIILSIVVGFVVFKMPYNSLRSFYKQHLHDIDVMLPYYLKGLEILVQHYTVPVALGKSIEDAPDIFKPGLRTLISRIDAGDSSIDPYMEFANTYPVRDSMRMMRLLYRLGIGSQEKKQERLLMFSRTVSNLQNKARETKYKERLNHMEGQTMYMLVATGGGVMVLILVSMMFMM